MNYKLRAFINQATYQNQKKTTSGYHKFVTSHYAFFW